MIFNTDGSRAYVSNTNSNDISVVNTDTNTVVDTLSLTGGPKSGMFNAYGSKAYIARSTTDQVVVADGETFTELSNITVGDSPVGVVAGASETATTSVDFTLAVVSSSALANTGQNAYIYLALAGGLLISPTFYLRKRLFNR